MTQVLAIVGMGEGIGMAIARKFAPAGYQIAMIARNATKLAAYQATLQSDGISAHYVPADAGDRESLEAAFANIRDQLGHPDILIYNAAVLRQQNILEESFEHLVDDFKVNVAGALVAVQAVLPAMRSQNQGSIFFTGGGLSLYPQPELASLSIGKAGIRCLAKTIAATLKETQIRVGTVTICGMVSPTDPKYNPELIADQFWTLHTTDRLESEIVY